MIFNRILKHVKRSRFQRRIYKYHWKQKPFPFSQAWEKSKKTNSTASPSSLHAATRVKKQQFRAKPLPSPFCRARLARFTTCRTLKSPSLSKYRTFSPVEQGEFSPSLSGSKLFTTAAVYARLDIYLQRERNGAAVSETASSQVEIKRRSETNFILRTEERSVQVLVTPASWETRLLFPFFLSHIFLLPWKTASRALTWCSSIVEHELV